MRYIRPRPWRSRGPWFSNRAGARRRGHRDDEGVSTAPVDIQDGDTQMMAADVEDDLALAEDILLPVAGTWPISERMRAAGVDDDRMLARTPGMPSHDRGPRQIGQIADTVITAPLLSRQSDDNTATSRSRQSA